MGLAILLYIIYIRPTFLLYRYDQVYTDSDAGLA